MAGENIRINDLTADTAPNANDVVPVDGATTRKSTLADVVAAGRPLASQAEAEAGTQATKAMTALTVKQAIAAQGATLFAAANQAVPTGGSTNQVLAKTSGTDNDVTWTSVGSGDLVGPSSATDAHIALFDGTTGKLLKDSTKAVSDLAQTASNLSDLADPDTALTNLGGTVSGLALFKASTVVSQRTSLNILKTVKDDFAAVGDGTTDDTAALQAALDSNGLVFLTPGRHRITKPLRVSPDRNRGCGFFGIGGYPSSYPTSSQTGGPSWDGTQEPWIFYDGPDHADMAGTSTTSVAIGTGSKSFTTDTGKAWVAGDPLRVSSDAVATGLELGVTNFMTGTVTSYDSATGALVFNSVVAHGSGTKTDWTIKEWTACFVASYEDVGVEVDSSSGVFDKTITALHMENIGFDGNNKADFGFYSVRMQEPYFSGCWSRNCVESGFAIHGTYSGAMYSCTSFLQRNWGFDFGYADKRWGWTQNYVNNAFRVYNLHASACGGDSTFRQSDALLRLRGAGVYWPAYRDNAIFGITSENNFGVSVIVATGSYGNTIYNIYTELSCKYAPGGAGTDAISLGYATDRIGFMVVGSPDSGTLGCRLVDGSLNGEVAWLTGTQPSSSRPEGGFEFYNITGGTGVIAEWGNYRLVNCGAEFFSGIVGSAPTGAFTVGGGIRLGYSSQTTLSDYREGSTVPTLAGASVAGTGWVFTSNLGAYTKVGRQVHGGGQIGITTLSTDATGQIVISLPFTIKSGNNFRAAAKINATGLTTSIVEVEGVLIAGSATIALYKRTAAAASRSSLTLSDLAVGSVIEFSYSYVAA